MKTAKEYWNEDSDDYFKTHEVNVKKLIADPSWAFPQPVMAMIGREFGDLKGKRVLVPSSGDNAAVYGFHLMGASVTSADISEEQLSHAKRIAVAYEWDIPFICDDSIWFYRNAEAAQADGYRMFDWHCKSPRGWPGITRPISTRWIKSSGKP